MAYSLQFHQEQVVPFIRDHPSLRRAQRVAIFAQLHGDLAVNAEHYLNDPKRRVVPGSSYFWYRAVARGPGDEVRIFRFAVNDEAARFGVLSLDYVDELKG